MTAHRAPCVPQDFFGFGVDCAVCSDPEHRMDAPWPCMTMQAISTALGVEP